MIIRNLERPYPERFDKLPKWAQNYITILERDNAERRQHIEQISGEPVTYGNLDPTKAYINHGMEHVYREVHRSTRVLLPCGLDRGHIEAGTEFSRDRVRVSISDGALAVTPVSSNVVYVGGGEW